MDDLQKDIYHVWELRLRIEKIKKRSKLMMAVLESDEFKEAHTEQEYKRTRKQLEAILSEQQELEEDQLRLEERVKLENPYLIQND